MTDEIQIPKTRFIATNDVEKLTSRRPYVAERFYLQMKNGPDLVLVRDVDYEATEKERDHWKARAERAEAEAVLLRGAIAAQDERNLAATERVGMAPADCDTPDWLAEEILTLRAELDAAHERIIQLVEYIMNSGGHVPWSPDASASDILGPLFAAPDDEQEARP